MDYDELAFAVVDKIASRAQASPLIREAWPHLVSLCGHRDLDVTAAEEHLDAISLEEIGRVVGSYERARETLTRIRERYSRFIDSLTDVAGEDVESVIRQTSQTITLSEIKQALIEAH